MGAVGSEVDWQQSQDALRDEVARVTALLRSIQDSGIPAVGQWNVGELAMHFVAGLDRRARPGATGPLAAL
jgi:hypothetical protein